MISALSLSVAIVFLASLSQVKAAEPASVSVTCIFTSTGKTGKQAVGEELNDKSVAGSSRPIREDEDILDYAKSQKISVRSVMPIDIAVSRAVLWGCCAIQLNTRAWFVRNFQSEVVDFIVSPTLPSVTTKSRCLTTYFQYTIRCET